MMKTLIFVGTILVLSRCHPQPLLFEAFNQVAASGTSDVGNFMSSGNSNATHDINCRSGHVDGLGLLRANLTTTLMACRTNLPEGKKTRECARLCVWLAFNYTKEGKIDRPTVEESLQDIYPGDGGLESRQSYAKDVEDCFEEQKPSIVYEDEDPACTKSINYTQCFTAKCPKP